MEIVLFLKNLLVSTGTAWVLWLLVALSVGSIGVIVERWLCFRSRSADLRSLTGELDAALARGSTTEAMRLLEARPSLASRVAIAGLRLADHGADAAMRGMESAMAVERAALDLRLDERDLRGRFGGRRGDELILAAERRAGVHEAAVDRVEVRVTGVLADIHHLERVLRHGSSGRQCEAGCQAEG